MKLSRKVFSKIKYSKKNNNGRAKPRAETAPVRVGNGKDERPVGREKSRKTSVKISKAHRSKILLGFLIYEFAVISCLAILTTRACARAGAALSRLVHQDHAVTSKS